MDTEKNPRRFDFDRDSFAFANELLWEYQFDAEAGKMNFRPREPKPDYTHRCFVLTCAARQFLYHARFDAHQKVAADETYRRLIGAVFPRIPCASENQIVIPGFPSLREFSAAREKLLKAECGGAWRSYILRSHWRMILPISSAHQERTASRLVASLEQNFSPVIHLVKFPSLTINHGMILFAAISIKTGVEFSAYDPNHPSLPMNLTFDLVQKTFSLPPNRYWAGGELKVIEIYRNWLI